MINSTYLVWQEALIVLGHLLFTLHSESLFFQALFRYLMIRKSTGNVFSVVLFSLSLPAHQLSVDFCLLCLHHSHDLALIPPERTLLRSLHHPVEDTRIIINEPKV